ncbi:MAG TPA: FAD/NAD(P)-binding oxidoreductase [Pyrinomonadaceae bacterium]|nr:FAD/NAD(P)-binding oxidoreductase [Pyrinomonadaceae bacterium]
MHRTTDILIVGGGPAGMAAALAASSHANVRVIVIDDNPRLGGQIWRAELGATKSTEAGKLIAALDERRIEIITGASVFGVEKDSLLAETHAGRVQIGYQKLIIATGARERFLPFPGWTLPNVFGAAGLQALVKGGLDVSGKRIVVAGTGPLLLVVAEYLRSKGGNVVAICEQTSNRKFDRFTLGLVRNPSKIFQGLTLRGRLRRIPYFRNAWIMSAHGRSQLEQVKIRRFGDMIDISCDMLACGFHLVPNLEVARLLGCRISNGYVAIDDHQRTSLPGVYCAGEPTGIGGVEAALVEGTIAGYAASGNADSARNLFRARRKTTAFAAALSNAFELRDELKQLPDGSTVVCRCEDVQYKKLTEYTDLRTAKLQTRCGMGPCQGRVCGPAIEFLFGWNDHSVRPPIVPVRMENL